MISNRKETHCLPSVCDQDSNAGVSGLYEEILQQIYSILYHYSDVIMSEMASQIDCLLHRLFRRRSKKAWKLRVTGLCEGNSPLTNGSPHKGQVTRKMLPFDDDIMIISALCKIHIDSLFNIQKAAFENAICKMPSILFWSHSKSNGFCRLWTILRTTVSWDIWTRCVIPLVMKF